jgi:endonuclease/exonuclease/phosphatase family metal-dependent hydrolase
MRACLLPWLLGLAAATTPAAELQLRLASWNLEWLVAPATAQAARLACLAGHNASLPCDVALDLRRGSADFAMLAAYARQLDADVVALQEVEDAGTAARLFKRHDFCFTARHAAQNVGFAIRRGLPYRCGPDYTALSLADSSRRGATLVLYPGTTAELHLLAVHLKSGCSREPLDAGTPACRTYARQLPVLADWLRQQREAGHRHAVLGDFNRELGDGSADSLLGVLAAGLPAAALLQDAAAGSRFQSCHIGQTFTRYIDHLLLGRDSRLALLPGSFHRTRYAAADVRRYRLSDHCPVSVLLRIKSP